MKNLLVVGLMGFLAFLYSLAFAQSTQPFPDVPKDHWAYQAVMELKQKGILIGYPDETFNGKTNRQPISHIYLALRDAPRIVQLDGFSTKNGISYGRHTATPSRNDMANDIFDFVSGIAVDNYERIYIADEGHL